MEDDRQARPEAAKALPKDFIEQVVRSRQTALDFSLCIASDDPRLKEK